LPLATRAPAKINLTLHVLGRRADGYHELESLVAFARTGDDLSLAPGPDLGLDVTGPTAEGTGPAGDNLILKASRLLAERTPNLAVGRFRLVKRLPVAAGVGGGSSDAAAALRLLARLNGLRLDDPRLVEAARATGADVPVCLEARARMMRGVGDRLGEPLRLPRLFAVLVNPGVPVETPAVFRRLGLQPGEVRPGAPHPDCGAPGSLLAALGAARNDLEPPARLTAPVIDDALQALRGSGALLARMSGSGATVFGLYADRRASALAARTIARAQPGWWVKATSIG